MEKLNPVEKTTYLPMVGRIYATENFPHILKDEKALSVKEKIPKSLFEPDACPQHMCISCAARSSYMDQYIKDFLSRKPNGVIVELGCGLETTFFRCDNGKTHWYEVDLPEVIDIRKSLFEENERDTIIPCDMFSLDWMKELREHFPTEPIMITGAGLFYYFEKQKIVELFRNIQQYGDVEIVFDSMSKTGAKMTSKYMGNVGHNDVSMLFYVDDAAAFGKEIGKTAELIKEEKYYARVDKKGLDFKTKASMWGSDALGMCTMIHMKL